MSGMCVFILTRRTLAIGLPQNGRFWSILLEYSRHGMCYLLYFALY